MSSSDQEPAGEPPRRKFDDIASLYGTIVPPAGSPVRPQGPVRNPLLPEVAEDELKSETGPGLAPPPGLRAAPSEPLQTRLPPEPFPAPAAAAPPPEALKPPPPEALKPPAPEARLDKPGPAPAEAAPPIKPRPVTAGRGKPAARVPWPDAFAPRPNFERAPMSRLWYWLFLIPFAVVVAVAITLINPRSIRDFVDQTLPQYLPAAVTSFFHRTPTPVRHPIVPPPAVPVPASEAPTPPPTSAPAAPSAPPTPAAPPAAEAPPPAAVVPAPASPAPAPAATTPSTPGTPSPAASTPASPAVPETPPAPPPTSTPPPPAPTASAAPAAMSPATRPESESDKPATPAAEPVPAIPVPPPEPPPPPAATPAVAGSARVVVYYRRNQAESETEAHRVAAKLGNVEVRSLSRTMRSPTVMYFSPDNRDQAEALARTLAEGGTPWIVRAGRNRSAAGRIDVLLP